MVPNLRHRCSVCSSVRRFSRSTRATKFIVATWYTPPPPPPRRRRCRLSQTRPVSTPATLLPPTPPRAAVTTSHAREENSAGLHRRAGAHVASAASHWTAGSAAVSHWTSVASATLRGQPAAAVTFTWRPCATTPTAICDTCCASSPAAACYGAKWKRRPPSWPAGAPEAVGAAGAAGAVRA